MLSRFIFGGTSVTYRVADSTSEKSRRDDRRSEHQRDNRPIAAKFNQRGVGVEIAGRQEMRARIFFLFLDSLESFYRRYLLFCKSMPVCLVF